MTRKELYELVWSEPVIKLAQQYGLSDRGLANEREKYTTVSELYKKMTLLSSPFAYPDNYLIMMRVPA